MDQGLIVLANCAISQKQTLKYCLNQEFVKTLLQLASQSDPTLVYHCILLAAKFDAVSRLPLLSVDVLTSLAGWLGTCYYDENYKDYRIKLPEPSTSIDPVCNILRTLHLATVNDNHASRCTLARALHAYSHTIQVVLMRGDDSAKECVTEVLMDLLKHDCGRCNTDYVRDILIHTGKSIQDILMLETSMSNIKGRFSWIAKHVPDKNSLYKIGTALGLSHEEIMHIGGNANTHVDATIKMLNTWKERSLIENEADCFNQLIGALSITRVTDIHLQRSTAKGLIF